MKIAPPNKLMGKAVVAVALILVAIAYWAVTRGRGPAPVVAPPSAPVAK